MILSELNKLLVNIASSNYLVNDAFVGDVYTINGKENRFGCFVATPMTANKMTVGTIRYNYVLYYIDRLTKDESNIDYVQSDAVSVLKGILNFIDEQGIEVEDGYEFTLFRQKFSDWCAGAYVSVNIMVPDYECGEGDFNTEGIDLRPLVTDRNGIYEAGSNGGFSRVTINVPQVGATEAWVDEEIDLKLTGYASQEWVNEQGFLTEHQDLSSYATKEYVDDGLDTLREEMPSLEGYATKNWVQNQGFLTGVPSSYATKAFVNNQGFLKEADLSDYALKSYVDNLDFLTEDDLTGYATQTWVNNQGFVNSESISDMATQTWVRQQGFLIDDDIEGLASKSWVGLQGYITEDDLCGYATEEWVNQQGFLIDDDLCGYATEEWTRNWVDNQGFLKPCNLEDFATQDWVENQGYLQEDDLEPYATNDWVDRIYATKDWVSENYVDFTTLDDYATKDWVSDNYIDNIEILSYATKNWVSSNFIDNTEIQSYATQTWTDNEINLKLTGYATQTWVQNKNYATQTWVQNQGYLTQHQDISGKVNYTDIWEGTWDEWDELTPEEQCSYLISLIIEEE